MLVEKNIHEDIWNELLAEKEIYTFFHTKQWLDILTKSNPVCKDESIYCEFDSGNRCILPLISTPVFNGIFKKVASTGPGSYSNVIGSICDTEKVQIIQHITSQPDIIQFSFANNPLNIEELNLPFFKTLDVTTHIVELYLGYEKIFNNYYSPNMRSKVRRSMKQGLELQGMRLEQGIDYFYNLYLLSVARWGDKLTQKRTFDFFKAVSMIKEDSVKLNIVFFQGRPIAGGIYYLFQKYVFFAFGAFDYDYRGLYPNIFLHDQSIRYFAKEGYNCYDMGADAGLDDVGKFKRCFETKEIKVPVYLWTKAIK